MVGDAARASMPMARVLAHELRIVGSHGMSARDFGPMLDLVAQGRLRPDRLVRAHIGLDETPAALERMGADVGDGGITVIIPTAG